MSAKEGKLDVAVITGGHAYDVPNFHKLFRSIGEADFFIQHMDDFASSSKAVRNSYDVVLFYIMFMAGPSDEGHPWYEGKPRSVLEHLGKTEQGIFVLHHAILAYPQWSVWNEIVGINDRSFSFYMNQAIHVDIASTTHPITVDLSGWDMIDETYTMADAQEGSDILLTVDHPKSMKNIAWTRQYKKSRVFCFQSGHDNVTWENANFREIVRRGILWCAKKI